MNEMESYMVIVGPVGDDLVNITTTVQAESEHDAAYRAGIVAMTERGLAAADYVVKQLISQTDFMADQGVSRARPYVDLGQDPTYMERAYAGPTEQQIMDWNIHNDHADELADYYGG